MKKDLVIIGSYPSTKKSSEILQKCILSLKDNFDILLSTHYPAEEEIQKLVNYYLYDKRNETIKNEHIYFWADYPTFYMQHYLDEDKPKGDYAFAIYRLIMNGLNLVSNEYDSFYYIEGDAIFSEKDILQLKDIKNRVINNNKKAWFMTQPDFLTTVVFYSTTNFFKSTFKFCSTVDEYEEEKNRIGSSGIIENFLYRSVIDKNVYQEILIEENKLPTDFFTSSIMSLTGMNNGSIAYGGYKLCVVKILGKDELAMIYINNDESSNDTLKIYLDDMFFTTIPAGKQTIVHKIHPLEDEFTIKIGNQILTYSKDRILSNKSYIQIK